MSQVSFPGAALRAIFWTQWTYWCSVGVAIWAAIKLPSGSIRSILVLTPILPRLLIIVVTYWIYRSCDEYIRMRILQACAITAIAVVFATMIYCFLELLGFPRLSMVWTSNLAWLIFIGQMLFLKFRAGT